MALLKKKQDPDDSSHLKGAAEQPTDDNHCGMKTVTMPMMTCFLKCTE